MEEQAPWTPGAPQLHLLALGIDMNPGSWKIPLRKFINKASWPRGWHSGTGTHGQVVLFVFEWDTIPSMQIAQQQLLHLPWQAPCRG